MGRTHRRVTVVRPWPDAALCLPICRALFRDCRKTKEEWSFSERPRPNWKLCGKISFRDKCKRHVFVLGTNWTILRHFKTLRNPHSHQSLDAKSRRPCNCVRSARTVVFQLATYYYRYNRGWLSMVDQWYSTQMCIIYYIII